MVIAAAPGPAMLMNFRLLKDAGEEFTFFFMVDNIYEITYSKAPVNLAVEGSVVPKAVPDFSS